jgi:hypothetical protein
MVIHGRRENLDLSILKLSVLGYEVWRRGLRDYTSSSLWKNVVSTAVPLLNVLLRPVRRLLRVCCELVEMGLLDHIMSMPRRFFVFLGKNACS